MGCTEARRGLCGGKARAARMWYRVVLLQIKFSSFYSGYFIHCFLSIIFVGKMKDRILSTLAEATEGLNLLNGDYYIIGSSAIILSGIDVGITHDIDILTNTYHSNVLRAEWNDKLVKDPPMKESNLFESDFACFQFSEMQIEVLGDLKVFKGDRWVHLDVNDYNIFKLNGLEIKIPTLTEQIRILNLFGRKKDMNRINIINEHMNRR